MSPNETFRLLILNDSQQEAERLISMLHNAGRPTRAQHATSEETLTKLLQDQPWDMLIAHDQTQKPTPSNSLKQIRRLNKDVPVILLTDDESTQAVVDGLKMGAARVVRLDEDQHLLLTITSELENRSYRQDKRIADRRFRESERRAQSLLDSSRDAIAYMQDGFYLYANESFAELFGYEDKDDIDCMPVMDMVADDDQPRLKDFLKEFTLTGSDSDPTKLELRGLQQDGTVTDITLEVTHATYDDEVCIQFLARASIGQTDSAVAEQLENIKLKDANTGLFNRTYIINHIEKCIGNIGDNQSSVFYIYIDDFTNKVQASLGVAGADKVLVNLAELLKNNITKKDTLARFGEGSFTILTDNITAEDAVIRAQALCKTIDDHIIDIEGRTLQLTANIGISLLNENASNAETVIEHALTAMKKAEADEETSVVLYEPPISAEEKEERDTVSDIQLALDNDRFRLLFQPIISLRDSDEEYYEVLLRMLNSEDEEVSPDLFFETALTMGVGTKIDRWIILESIKMLSEHRSRSNKTQLIINLSSDSLFDKTLTPWLAVAFKAAKLPGSAIVFQIREADATGHLNAAKELSKALIGMGSSLSISHFGCALNPFNTLKHVDANMIKVDGSFTLDIQNNNENPDALIELIKSLSENGKITIVPFVENASVLSTLWQAGADYIQGHYLQGPTHSMSYEFDIEA